MMKFLRFEFAINAIKTNRAVFSVLGATFMVFCSLGTSIAGQEVSRDSDKDWVIDSNQEWKNAVTQVQGVEFTKGMASPTGAEAKIVSVIKSFREKRAAQSIQIDQSPVWQNWQPIDNLGPSNLGDAPVMLSLGKDNYWMFGRYGGGRKRGTKSKATPFQSEPAKLDGFDIPLRTTKFAKQYDAPED